MIAMAGQRTLLLLVGIGLTHPGMADSERICLSPEHIPSAPAHVAPGHLSLPTSHELNAILDPRREFVYFTRRINATLRLFRLGLPVRGAAEALDLIADEKLWDEVDPWFSADGSQMYFISNAPAAGLAQDSVNLWAVDRLSSGEWSKARVLPAPVNTDAHEIYPVSTSDGRLYFSSTRPGGLGKRDLYRTDGDWRNGQGQVQNLGVPLNSPHNEGDAYVDSGERFIILTSDRPGGMGKSDLYISQRVENGQWSPPINMGPGINTPEHEFAPVVHASWNALFFSRSGDVYCKSFHYSMGNP